MKTSEKLLVAIGVIVAVNIVGIGVSIYQSKKIIKTLAEEELAEELKF